MEPPPPPTIAGDPAGTHRRQLSKERYRGFGIYVWPREILQAIYQDLEAGNKPVRGFQIAHSREVVGGHECDKVEIVFDTCSRMSKSGRINLQEHGISRLGVVEAEREAVMGIIEALRTTHGIIHADYNHIRIGEERQRYKAAQVVLGEICKEYGAFEDVVRSCHRSLGRMLSDVSRKLGRFVLDGQYSDQLVAFSALHTTLSQYSPQMDEVIAQSGRKVQLTIAGDVEPEAKRRFNATVPMPMAIDWDASFAVLQVILVQAARVLNLELSEIIVVELDDGRFEARLDVIVDPYRLHGPDIEQKEVEFYRDPRSFCSSPYSSVQGAKALVVYEAVKHVVAKLHGPIVDLNYDLYRHQQSFLGHHDSKMKEIVGCGYSLDRALRLCEEYYRWSSDDIKSKIAIAEHNAGIFEVIERFGAHIAEARSCFAGHWEFFLSCKDRSDAILRPKYKLF